MHFMFIAYTLPTYPTQTETFFQSSLARHWKYLNIGDRLGFTIIMCIFCLKNKVLKPLYYWNSLYIIVIPLDFSFSYFCPPLFFFDLPFYATGHQFPLPFSPENLSPIKISYLLIIRYHLYADNFQNYFTKRN